MQVLKTHHTTGLHYYVLSAPASTEIAWYWRSQSGQMNPAKDTNSYTGQWI